MASGVRASTRCSVAPSVPGTSTGRASAADGAARAITRVASTPARGTAARSIAAGCQSREHGDAHGILRRVTATDPVIAWLLDADPAIRWQVMRDLLDAPEAEWQAERAKVETEGWGARLLAHEDADGLWAGGVFAPRDFDPHEWRSHGQPWTATCWALHDLREFGLDPASDRARRAVELVGENARWEHDGQPFWEGEVEECINGRTVADGAYFGV